MEKKLDLIAGYFEGGTKKTDVDANLSTLCSCAVATVTQTESSKNSAKILLALDFSGVFKRLSFVDRESTNRASIPSDVRQFSAGTASRFSWEAKDGDQAMTIFKFDKDFFLKYCPELLPHDFLSGHLVPEELDPKPELGFLIQVLTHELDDDMARGQIFTETLVRLIAIEIAQTVLAKQSLVPHSNFLPDYRVGLVVKFIHANFAENVSLRQLGNIAGLSATHLINCFKLHTGKTPYAYLVATRVEEAKRLLLCSQKPISEIALAVGFYDQQQMTHVFRKKLNCTPNSFRKSYKLAPI